MAERGITQEALANKIDRGQSWVNHKLSGRRKANVEDLVLIARALNIPPAQLLDNLTNADQLRDSFIRGRSAEPNATYSTHSLTKLEQKINELEPKARNQFLDQVESILDLLIKSEASKK